MKLTNGHCSQVRLLCPGCPHLAETSTRLGGVVVGKVRWNEGKDEVELRRGDETGLATGVVPGVLLGLLTKGSGQVISEKGSSQNGLIFS